MSINNDELSSVETDSEVRQQPIVDVTETVPAVASFEEAGLSANVIAAVRKIGWQQPTPVQGMCLPLTTKGRDVAGFAHHRLPIERKAEA